MFSPTINPSRIAKFAVDDGDDLHITESFRALEENSSTIGNLSCADTHHEIMYGTLSTKTAPNTYNRKIVESDEARDEEQYREPMDSGNRTPLRPMVGKFNVFANGRNQRLKAWQANSFLNRSKQALATREYQEIEEEQEVQSTAPGPSAFGSVRDHSVSNRSSRLNLANGKPILTRQKAQVMNRPSVAQADWDVGSIFSTASNESTLETPEQNLNWDNASLGAISEISHLTGDSLSLREKQSDISMSRAMYIHPFHGAECDEESDDEEVYFDQPRSRSHGLHDLSNFEDPIKDSASPSKSMTMPPVLRQFVTSMTTTNEENETNILSLDDARAVVNEVLRNSKTDFVQVSGWDLRDVDADDISIVETQENRVRVYSDSDMILEKRRRRSCDFHERRSPETSAAATADGDEEDIETGEVSAFRARSQSETLSRDGVHTELLMMRPRCTSDDWKSLGDGSTAATLTSERTNVGRIQLGPVRIPHLRRARSVSADSHPLLEHFHKQEANRTVSLLDVVDDDQWLEGQGESRDASSKPRAAILPKLGKTLSSSKIGSTLTATASRVSATTKRIAGHPFARNQMRRLPSATAVSAAKQLASALRPPSASMAGSRASSMQDYYWSTGNENDEGSDCGEDVLWSLSAESFEDLL